ncbi:MAG: hypothetical protein ACP5OG_03830 [Candidatus Nanoarchaeia archaeon]
MGSNNLLRGLALAGILAIGGYSYLSNRHVSEPASGNRDVRGNQDSGGNSDSGSVKEGIARTFNRSRLERLDNILANFDDPFIVISNRNNYSIEGIHYFLKTNAKRKLKLGVALEDASEAWVREGISNANLGLFDYGIYLDLEELVNVELPNSFSDSYLESGIKGSFSHQLDHYLVFSSADLKKGENNYSVKSLTDKSLCLIDGGVKKDQLDKFLICEILRKFSDSKPAYFGPEFSLDCLKGIEESKIQKNTEKIFSAKGYDLRKDNKTRIVSANIGLDGFPKEDAENLLSKASKNYEENFGIKIVPIGFYEHKLSGSWNTFSEMESFSRNCSEKSDIYLLLTNQNWGSKSDGPNESVSGEALPKMGYSWIEVNHGKEKTVKTLNHEIGHLFGADHIYLKGAIMHPYNNTGEEGWTNKDKAAILKNKYIKWDN